jgi:hypothetical protein
MLLDFNHLIGLEIFSRYTIKNPDRKMLWQVKVKTSLENW